MWKSKRGTGWLIVLGILAILLYALVEEDEEWDNLQADPAKYTHAAAILSAAVGEACEAYEVEVENGICSYIVECEDAVSCEAWAASLLLDLAYWYGDLVDYDGWDSGEEESERDPEELAAFMVMGNGIDYDRDEYEEYYAWLWNRFAWIIPSDERKWVHRFEIFDHDEMMAYVVQDELDVEKWIYGVNYIQSVYEIERIATDIHELGHLLSLNVDQVDPTVRRRQCQTYMLDEGCAREDAYIYHFYQRFWEDGASEDEDDYVTEYAMENLYEDFAESWTYFVLTLRPESDSMADQKVSFFYEYDELIVLKAHILGRAASWLDRFIDYDY